MMIQKIMVPFIFEHPEEPAFASAVILAERFKAHLDVVHMRRRIIPTLPSGSFYPIAMVYTDENLKAMEDALDQKASTLKRVYEHNCRKWDVSLLSESEHSEDKGVTAAWTDIEAMMPYDLASRARVADLCVVAKAGKDGSVSGFDVMEEIIFQSGRPVLWIEGSHALQKFPEKIVIAWNGSKEAVRAISAAMPILRQAKLVTVISIGDLAYGSQPPEHLVSYLKLHGVHATYINVGLNKGVHPEEEFMAQAKKNKADLIVMGAYSHNRWREVILGGFTRHMLKNSHIPLLLMH